MLERLGCTVSLAEDGEVALEHVTTNPPDMLLTDIEMPKLDGYGLASCIRELEQKNNLRHIPTIVLSAHTFAEHQEKAKLHGVDGYVPRPIMLKELKEGILSTLKHSST